MPSSVSNDASAPSRSPRVSFIIPLYNCLGLTQAMLASLQASLPPDLTFEIIFVDDGSTDGTRDWLASLPPDLRVVLNEKNLGYAGANNRGAANARGEFLVLLNNDLILRRGWIQPMLALHRRLGSRAGLIGNVQRTTQGGAIDHAGIVINHKGKPEHDRSRPWWWLFPGSWRSVVAATGACLLVERALWNQVGGFDETYLNGCEDVDLCFRVAALGRVNAVSLTSVVQHHVSASPGRKRRDEENTCKLVSRWREQLVPLGAKAWCRHHLEIEWTTSRDPAAHAMARELFLYAYGLKRQPPQLALAGMNQSIETELARWRKIFGPT